MFKFVKRLAVRMRRRRMVRANSHAAFNPDNVVWRLDAYTATSDNMRRHCLHSIMKECTDNSDAILPHVNQVYDKNTQEILDKVSKYYQGKVYQFRNIRYSASELQSVVIGFAVGRLPLNLFKYYDGSKYTCTVPHCPTEGAEIVTMPNYDTFAVYHNGVWELNLDVVQADANHVPVTSRILPYIAGTRTVTCGYTMAVYNILPNNALASVHFQSMD